MIVKARNSSSLKVGAWNQLLHVISLWLQNCLFTFSLFIKRGRDFVLNRTSLICLFFCVTHCCRAFRDRGQLIHHRITYDDESKWSREKCQTWSNLGNEPVVFVVALTQTREKISLSGVEVSETVRCVDVIASECVKLNGRLVCGYK